MSTTVPDAELLIASGCAHCPVVLSGLAELVKQGLIGRLDVVNVGRHPEVAEAHGVRGVPWVRIGPFELSGAHSQSELAAWAERAGSEEGARQYLREGLERGELDGVVAACRRSPALLPGLLALAGDLDTPFAVRVGVGAVLEELGAAGLLAERVSEIASLAGAPQPQVRADAAHFLALTGSQAALEPLRGLARDPDEQVREIAAESLEALGHASD